ncbi:MAG: hypothetical protein MUF34_06780 [Polyangiaceae bacterium]|jgi:hypothetical protein|nr:hypothetical protein [Polyangiaceae bacterium]
MAIQEEELATISTLYRLVQAVGDALGSEGTESGQALLTTLKSLRSACRTHFPKGYRFEPLTREQFTAAFGEETGELVRFCEPYSPTFGLAGHPERFRPDEHARGEFWVCIFLAGPPALYRSALLRFPRVET